MKFVSGRVIISIFSFSHIIFKSFHCRGRSTLHCVVKFKQSLFRVFKQATVFMGLQYKSFENTGGNGEIARNKQFLLFPQCFLPILRTFWHFHQVQNRRLQTLLVWKSVKFVIWEMVKDSVGKQEIVYYMQFLLFHGIFKRLELQI